MRRESYSTTQELGDQIRSVRLCRLKIEPSWAERRKQVGYSRQHSRKHNILIDQQVFFVLAVYCRRLEHVGWSLETLTRLGSS